jgi:hypothetical protein
VQIVELAEAKISGGQALWLQERALFLPGVHAHQVALFGVQPLINYDVIQLSTYSQPC